MLIHIYIYTRYISGRYCHLGWFYAPCHFLLEPEKSVDLVDFLLQVTCCLCALFLSLPQPCTLNLRGRNRSENVEPWWCNKPGVDPYMFFDVFWLTWQTWGFTISLRIHARGILRYNRPMDPSGMELGESKEAGDKALFFSTSTAEEH